MQNFKQDLTSGSVTKRLIKFAMPLLLSNVIQALYAVADMWVVGKFVGSYGISGVGIGSQVTNLVASLIIGFSIGATVLIAQYIGAKKDEEVEKTVATVITAVTILGAIVTVIMLFANVPLLRLIRVPEESFEYAKEYTAICLSGTVFIFLYNGIAAIMRGFGDSKRPLLFVTIAAVTNVFLDLLLVGVFKMEVAGAAWATITAQAVSVIISAIYLYKKGFVFDFKFKSFTIHMDKLKQIIKLGSPTALQQVLVSFSFLFLTGLINLHGVNASSAANVVSKIGQFIMMPVLAMSSSISSMAGQNVGAKQFDRAFETLKVGIRISFVLTVVLVTIVQFFPEPLLRLFTDNPDDIAIAVPYLRVITLDWIFATLLINCNGLIIGAGHTTITLFNALLSNVIFRVPFAYILSELVGLGMQGIALGSGIAPAATTVFALWYVLTGRWKDESRRRCIVLE